MQRSNFNKIEHYRPQLQLTEKKALKIETNSKIADKHGLDTVKEYTDYDMLTMLKTSQNYDSYNYIVMSPILWFASHYII